MSMRLLLTFVLLTSAVFIVCNARPSFRAFQGLDRLRSHSSQFVHQIGHRDDASLLHPQEFATIHADDFTFQDGDDLISFRYEAEVTPDANVVRLDEEDDVEAVSCHGLGYRQPNMMHLHTNSSQAAQRILARLSQHANTLMAGGHEWNCKTTTQNLRHGKAILRRILAAYVLAQDPSTIVVKTELANHTDFFKSLLLEFSTKKMPTPNLVPRASNPAPLAKPINKRSWGSFFSNIWHSISDVAEDVSNVVTTGINVISSLATGDIYINEPIQIVQEEYQQTVTLDDNGLECSNCGASLDIGVDFGLTIQDYNLINASVIATGNVDIEITAAMSLSAQYQNSAAVDLYTLSWPEIPLTIGGIPMLISLVAPISAEFDIDVSASVSASATVQCSGQVSYGVSWQEDNFLPINSHSYSQTGSLQGLEVEVEIEAQVALLIVPEVRVDYIVYADLGIKPYLALDVTYNSNSTACPETGTSALLNWGVQVTAGANFSLEPVLDVQFSYGPEAIGHIQRPIYAQCLGSQNSATEAHYTAPASVGSDLSSLIPGMTWYGEQSGTCEGSLQGSVTLQFLGVADDGYDYMVLSENLVMPDYTWCLAQILYEVNLYGTSLTLNLVTADGYAVGYLDCQESQYESGMDAVSLQGQVSADFSSIDLSDGNCVQVTVTGAPSPATPTPTPAPVPITMN